MQLRPRLTVLWALHEERDVPISGLVGNGINLSRLCCPTQLNTKLDRRDMMVEDRINYISAVKCLQATPSSATRQGVKTRFDEFQASHIDLTNRIHGVVCISLSQLFLPLLS
jgi:tyrosinase